MPGDRPRLPRHTWVYVASAVWCFAVVCQHVAAIATGQPLGTVFWALPLNVLTIAFDVRLIRAAARRAAAVADERAGARMRG